MLCTLNGFCTVTATGSDGYCFALVFAKRSELVLRVNAWISEVSFIHPDVGLSDIAKISKHNIFLIFDGI